MQLADKKELLLPPFYYPTQSIFVDDDENFIFIFPDEAAFIGELDNYHTFTSPTDAINFVQHYENMPFLSNLLLSKSKDFSKNSVDEFTLDQTIILNSLTKDQRFKEISSAVVDYSMPEMEGITFCKFLDKRTKRIILTGLGDQKAAIRAFNSKLIDQYIDKGTLDAAQKIAQLINYFQEIYFIEACDAINKFLGKTHFLNEKNFAMSFKLLCEQNNIIEYYLIRPTQILCLNRQGNHFLLIAENYDSIAKHYQKAVERDAPNEVIDILSNASHVPYFPTNDGFFDSTIKNWELCFHEKYTISGQEKYFCAFIESPEIKNLYPEDIVSYETYLTTKA